MIRLVHLDRSRSERIIWLLDELGLPYALDAFQRRPDLYGPDEMRQAHVLGRAPVIYDGDVVTETWCSPNPALSLNIFWRATGKDGYRSDLPPRTSPAMFIGCTMRKDR